MELPSSEGAIVDDVVAGSPAEKAGLEHGDVITTLDGEKVIDFHDFQLKIGVHLPGDTVQLEIYRDGKKKSIALTLADRDDYSEIADSGESQSWLGINAVNINSQMAQQYNLSEISSGVLIVKIDENSPASEANLLEGDVILEIEDKKINNIEDFNAAKDEHNNSDKPVLIYRLRKNPNGSIEKGYVAIKTK